MPELTRRGVVAATVAAGATLLAGGSAAAEEKPAKSLKAEDVMDASSKAKLRLATKRWIHIAGYTSLDQVVSYVNTPTAQVAGEVVVVPVGGKFDILVFI